MNKWEQFKRYLFSDTKKNSWIKSIYFFLLKLNFKADVFGAGGDAFLLRSHLERQRLTSSSGKAHILFLAGEIDLKNKAQEALLQKKISELKFPRFVFVFGAIAASQVKKNNKEIFHGDFFIPGGNFLYEHLNSLRDIVLRAVVLTPEKIQGKYDKME